MPTQLKQLLFGDDAAEADLPNAAAGCHREQPRSHRGALADLQEVRTSNRVCLGPASSTTTLTLTLTPTLNPTLTL